MMRRRLIPTIGGKPARDRAGFRRLSGGAIIILVALQLAHLTPETSYADDGLIARGSYLVHAAELEIIKALKKIFHLELI